jgi:hypothetical protein
LAGTRFVMVVRIFDLGYSGRGRARTCWAIICRNEQTVADGAGPLHQLGQVLKLGQDPDVGVFVDDGLDAQSPPFVQVVLDPAVLEGRDRPAPR